MFQSIKVCLFVLQGADPACVDVHHEGCSGRPVRGRAVPQSGRKTRTSNIPGTFLFCGKKVKFDSTLMAKDVIFLIYSL